MPTFEDSFRSQVQIRDREVSKLYIQYNTSQNRRSVLNIEFYFGFSNHHWPWFPLLDVTFISIPAGARVYKDEFKLICETQVDINCTGRCEGRCKGRASLSFSGVDYVFKHPDYPLPKTVSLQTMYSREAKAAFGETPSPPPPDIKPDGGVPKKPLITLRFRSRPSHVTVESLNGYPGLSGRTNFSWETKKDPNAFITAVFRRDGYATKHKKVRLNTSQTVEVSLEQCPTGKVSSGLTCCWPGQAAKTTKCSGRPTRCPSGLVIAGRSCRKKAISNRKGMSLIPAGTFMMGCQRGDSHCEDNEKPAHRVRLDAYYIDQTEVTVAAYRKCVQAKKCKAPKKSDYSNYDKRGRDNHPVNEVNWHDAKVYCAFVGKRLPTEAEWENAARAQDGDVYPWGDSSPNDKRARFDKDDNHKTVPVRSYAAGAHGLYDMAGNLWEWVEDCYGYKAYKRSDNTDKLITNPVNGRDVCPSGRRVLRGGAFFHRARGLRASFRYWVEPGLRNRSFGFRCVAPA